MQSGLRPILEGPVLRMQFSADFANRESNYALSRFSAPFATADNQWPISEKKSLGIERLTGGQS